MRLPIREILIAEGRRPTRNVEQLAESIRTLGLMNPITVTPQKRLVAGRNRLEACQLLGWSEIPAVMLPLDALHCELAEIDENLIRNDLTVLERGEQLARRKAIYEALHPETRSVNERGGPGRGNKTGEIISPVLGAPTFADDTASHTGVTKRTVQQEVQIAEKIAPEVKELIRDHEVADVKTDLLALARIKDAEEQRAVAERVVSGECETVRDAVRDVRRASRPHFGDAGPLPADGKYDVIYADPPWRYEHCKDSADEIENQYPTMSLDDICALGVSEIAAEDAVLFLWTTAPKLAEAMRVIDAWGFSLRSGAVWVKSGLGMGYYFRVNHEHLLVATKGTPGVPEPADRPVSVFEHPKSRHSEKPDAFYGMIERMYPRARRIELFCREAHVGWSAWGNEVTS